MSGATLCAVQLNHVSVPESASSFSFGIDACNGSLSPGGHFE